MGVAAEYRSRRDQELGGRVDGQRQAVHGKPAPQPPVQPGCQITADVRVAEEHDGRQHLAAKLSRHLGVGIRVVVAKENILGDVDTVRPIGDSLLRQAAYLASH